MVVDLIAVTTTIISAVALVVDIILITTMTVVVVRIIKIIITKIIIVTVERMFIHSISFINFIDRKACSYI